MTRSNILSRPSSAESSRRWNLRKFDVVQETIFVGDSANINLLWKILVIGFIWARILWSSPTNNSSKRMDQHRVIIRQTNRLNRSRVINRILHRHQSNVGIKVFSAELPIRMNFNLHQLSLLRSVFKIPQVMSPSNDISVRLIVMGRVAALRPEAMSGW